MTDSALVGSPVIVRRAGDGTPRTLSIDAVLFDLDGTLADTAPDLIAALNRVRGDHGRDPLPLAHLRPYASQGARGMLGAGMDVAPEHPDFPALRDAFLDYYALALCNHSKLFAGVVALLETIETRALKWGIVTNKATRFTTPLLEALELSGRPDVVVCGDTTPHAKPHPAPLLFAAEAMGVAPERCLYVGDAERDIVAGVAAGMPTIVARYGYIEPRETPHDWPAEGMIDDPEALLRWLPTLGSGDVQL